MKITLIQCDLCGKKVDPTNLRWEAMPSNISIFCPTDGINGQMDYEVCVDCRRTLHNTIVDMVKVLKRRDV